MSRSDFYIVPLGDNSEAEAEPDVVVEETESEEGEGRGREEGRRRTVSCVEPVLPTNSGLAVMQVSLPYISGL